jgi:hypothetical protein
MINRLALAAALAIAPLPAFAQTVTAEARAAIDPARLEIARQVVARVFPVGTYRKMMGASMDKLMGSIMDGTMSMPIGQIAAMGGLETDAVAKLDQISIGEIMAVFDPHYRERTELGMRAMMASMGGLMESFEPRVQVGMARAYARKFSATQLAELDRFFATPTGSFYASESMTLAMDPEIMAEMQAMMPEMMAKMPDFMKAMTEATKDLPPARKPSEMTAADRAKLAKLLGIDEKDLRDVDTKDITS